MTVYEQMQEAIRLVQGSERVAAIAEPIKSALTLADRVLEVVPELEPEIEELKTRLLEMVEHCVSAGRVLSEKMSLLVDE